MIVYGDAKSGNCYKIKLLAGLLDIDHEWVEVDILAHGSLLLPDDPYERALVLQWQFFEQYSHEPYIAVARFINKYLGLPGERCDEYRAKQAGGHCALRIMDGQLQKKPFVAGERFTIADISLYAYTHVADEGGFDLAAYPAIGTWLGRVASQPGYVPMDETLS